ncbi:MAG: hypothetical protein EZS28_040369 [Streblomastix strix]|uniref:Uncharacterized protein n=1 Tax=Streblomastix strix TaxID=222440 RepID=A0A5J4U1G8_9EUKA|nr:MAG: hypothetical protein EZS28_040369 [Streblomastix strix]
MLHPVDEVQHQRENWKQQRYLIELGIKDKRNQQVTTGKSKLQHKAYEVSPKPQRICEFNPQQLKAITVQQFMSTIIGLGQIAIDALNQVWKKEFPCIHPPIPLLPAVLKKIREEQIEAMIIAPLWQCQI